MNTILCFKWGTKYTAQYVNNLYRAIIRNSTNPIRFVCVTDDNTDFDPGIESKPLINGDFEGWWQKITAFVNPLYDITGPVLVIDLDMVIVDNIDCFFEIPGKFFMERDYIPRNGLSTCLMRFEANENVDIYNDLKKQDTSKYWGDQVWVTMKRPAASTWPDSWVKSYKWECISNNQFKIPEGCKIIKFHGLPTIVNTLPFNHINQYWY